MLFGKNVFILSARDGTLVFPCWLGKNGMAISSEKRDRRLFAKDLAREIPGFYKFSPRK